MHEVHEQLRSLCGQLIDVRTRIGALDDQQIRLGSQARDLEQAIGRIVANERLPAGAALAIDDRMLQVTFLDGDAAVSIGPLVQL